MRLLSTQRQSYFGDPIPTLAPEHNPHSLADRSGNPPCTLISGHPYTGSMFPVDLPGPCGSPM